MGLPDFVRESNRIEGITRDPTPDEITAHERVLILFQVSPVTLGLFQSVIAPDKPLRMTPGMDDAALTLVPELNEKLRPLQILFGVSESGKYWTCTITNWQWGVINSGRTISPAIALCIAALKANVEFENKSPDVEKKP